MTRSQKFNIKNAPMKNYPTIKLNVDNTQRPDPIFNEFSKSPKIKCSASDDGNIILNIVNDDDIERSNIKLLEREMDVVMQTLLRIYNKYEKEYYNIYFSETSITDFVLGSCFDDDDYNKNLRKLIKLMENNFSMTDDEFKSVVKNRQIDILIIYMSRLENDHFFRYHDFSPFKYYFENYNFFQSGENKKVKNQYIKFICSKYHLDINSLFGNL